MLPPPAAPGGALERVATPGKRTVEEVSRVPRAAAGALREDAPLPDAGRRGRRGAGARRSRGVRDEAPGRARRRRRSTLADERDGASGSPARRSGSPGRSGSACASSPTRRCAACAARSSGANRADEHVVERRPGARLPGRRVRRPAPGARRRPLPALRRRRVRRAIAASRSGRCSTSAPSTARR